MGLIRMSGRSGEILSAAANWAVSLGHGRLSTVHVILALLDVRCAAQVAIFRQAAEDAPSRLRNAAAAVYRGPEATTLRELERDRGETREALASAQDEAEVAGSFAVHPVHLFLAMTGDDSWTAYRALHEIGVDVERARRAASDLARDEEQGSLPSE